MSILKAALLVSGDLLQLGSQLNGRRWAAQSWMRHWVRTNNDNCLNLLLTNPDHSAGSHLQRIFAEMGWHKDIQLCDMAHPSSMQNIDVLFVPDPSIGRWGQWRQPVSADSFSIVGQIHTISSSASQSLLLYLVSEPVYSWDAVVCSSSAGRDVVLSLIQDREEQHDGLVQTAPSRSSRPQLPVIPLPVGVEI